MAIEQTTMYRSSDGRLHPSHEAAQEYEDNLARHPEVKALLVRHAYMSGAQAHFNAEIILQARKAFLEALS